MIKIYSMGTKLNNKKLYLSHNCKVDIKSEEIGMINQHTHECHMSNVVFEIFNLDILGSLYLVLTQMLCALGKIKYLAMNKI